MEIKDTLKTIDLKNPTTIFGLIATLVIIYITYNNQISIIGAILIAFIGIWLSNKNNKLAAIEFIIAGIIMIASISRVGIPIGLFNGLLFISIAIFELKFNK